MVMASRFSKVDATKLLLCSVFITFVFFPFFVMVAKITPEDFRKVVTSANFIPALKNSLKLSLTTTVISVSLGLVLAFCIQRTNMRMKNIWTVMLTLPMLIPSISHAMGLVVLFGTNGVINNLLGFQNTIYGYAGIITGSVLYSYPISFLMFNDVLKYQDASPYEAAQVLGIPKFRQMTAITMPYMVKPLISAVFTVFTLVVTDYGIPLLIGGKHTTLAKMMYQEVLGQLNFGKGSIIGLLLLVPALLTFVFNTFVKSRGKLSFVTKPFEIKKNRLRNMLFAVGWHFWFCFCLVLSVQLHSRRSIPTE